jgi:hypothetical protein
MGEFLRKELSAKYVIIMVPRENDKPKVCPSFKTAYCNDPVRRKEEHGIIW